MSRTLRILFRRDPAKDRHRGSIFFEGYQVLWPDGRPVAVGLDGFCKHGQRLLGLGRHLAGCKERLIDLLCFPLRGRDDDLTRIKGHRVRRFMLMREGSRGRLHFLDGTPTETVFDLGRDEYRPRPWRRKWFGRRLGKRERNARFFAPRRNVEIIAARHSSHAKPALRNPGGFLFSERHRGFSLCIQIPPSG